jgi:AcrR family transcriptional regulator
MGYVSVEERREQLIAAAVRVIARDGLRGVTTRRIADEAGAPLASIHYSFESKDDVIEAALERIIGAQTEPIAALVDRSGGVARAIRTMVTSYWAAARDLGMESLFTYGEDERARRFALTQYSAYQQRVVAVLEETVAASRERLAVGVDQLARLLVLCADGLLTQYVVERDAARTEADVLALAEALIALAAPRPLGRTGAQAPKGRSQAPRSSQASRPRAR